MSHPDSGIGLVLKADSIAIAFRDEVKQSVTQLSLPPKLVGILSTSSAPSKFYAEFTKKQCNELGIQFELKLTGAARSTELREGEEVEDAIIEANEDESVDGIMVCLSDDPCNLFTNTISTSPTGILSYLRCTAGPYLAFNRRGPSSSVVQCV
jgi:hypothetical protein